MAVRSSTFEIAAFDAEAKAKGEQKYVELTHGGGRFSLWRAITQGQFGRFTITLNRGQGLGRIGALDDFLVKVMLTPEEIQALADSGELDVEGVPYAERIKAGAIPVGPDYLWDAFEAGAFKDEDGADTITPIYQMVGTVLNTSTGFPTESSSGSTSTRKATGPRSTATSRRQGSTRSSSPRAASPA